MRFRDTPFIKRVFGLVRNRNLPTKLILYIMQVVEPSLAADHVPVLQRSRQQLVLLHNWRSTQRLRPHQDPKLTTPQDVSRMVAGVFQLFHDLFRARLGGGSWILQM